MYPAQVVVGVVVVPHQNSPEVLEPSEEALDFPSALVAPQGAPILSFGSLAVAPVRGDHLDAVFAQPLIEWITVVGAVTDEPSGCSSNVTCCQSWFDKGDFMRRSSFKVQGERKTNRVCHRHDLATFAALGLSHARPPFLATMKVPSMKHSLKSNSPRSCRSRASASSTLRNAPDLTQLWKRRWQV